MIFCLMLQTLRVTVTGYKVKIIIQSINNGQAYKYQKYIYGRLRY